MREERRARPASVGHGRRRERASDQSGKTEGGSPANHQWTLLFMSSLPLQYDPPSQDVRRQLSGSSLALICVFFSCFIGIAYLTSKTPRAPTATPMPVFPASPPTRRRFTARRRRPRLWEIWLDEYLGGTVHNWRVSHPRAFQRHID
jgi:hypothetical protein